MSTESREDRSLDGMIDATARDLTAGSPSPALQARVRARIRGERSATAWRFPGPRAWRPAVGAAALSVLVMLWWRPPVDAPVPGRPAAPTEARQDVQLPEEPVAVAARPSSELPPRQRRTFLPVGDAAFAPTDIDLPIEPLVIEPISAGTTVVEEIAEPTPLDSAGLEIRPLSDELVSE